MRKILMILLSAGALAACGQTTPGTTTGAATSPATAAQPSPDAATSAPTAAPEPTAAQEPTAMPEETAAPTSVPRPTAGQAQPTGVQPVPGSGLSVAPPQDLVEAAQRQLAAYFKLSTDQVMLQSANKQTWPDGALGCPAPGTAYPQVVTEGFQLIFANADQSQTYDVHTALTPAAMVLCQAGQPIDLAQSAGVAPPASDEVNRYADLARTALASEIGVKAADITLVSAEAMEWNDSSLGCPKPGEAYLQVITSGYKIVLEAQGKRYEYHSGQGDRVVRCDAPASTGITR